MANNGLVRSASDQIRHEEDRWRAVLDQVLNSDAELVSVSRYCCDSRVYRSGGRVAKIRRILDDSNGRTDLETEVACLKALGREATYGTWAEWEYSVQERIPGSAFSNYLFDQQESSFDLRSRFRVIRNLLPELKELHRNGVSHGDLNPENMLIDGSAVTLVDFDRAAQGSRLRMAYRDWVGVGRGLQRRTPVWKLALFTLVPKSRSIARRVRWRLSRQQPDRTASKPMDIAGLRDAWRLAQSSPANSRGQGLAYYAWSYRGVHFKGERAWQLRWDAIAKAIDFSGKSVLELGCNMGLLSIFAVNAGAQDVLGVDRDATIIEAARRAASALGSEAKFEQVDITAPDDWESRLGGRDIVTALSIVHWLPNRDRVMSFLAQHRELLYEGHDRLEVETERLRAIGFDVVQLVMTTERDRHLLYARQSSKR